MIYFAYGSNMLERRLQDMSRAPSATFEAIAVLRGRELRFNKRGSDGSGKCNLVEGGEPNCEVFGVLFDIAEKDFATLDAAEDTHRGGYTRCRVVVERLDSAQQVEVETYIANDDFVDENLKPFDWYQALVVAGAMQHRLPSTYSAKLRAVRSLPDSDPDRRDRELDLLGNFRLAIARRSTTG